MKMNPTDRLRRKIVIIFGVFAIIVLTMFAIYYYVVIQKTTFEDLDKTMKAVENSEKIKEIDEVHQFYEEIGYHIFEGMNEKDEAVFLFVPIESVDDESAWKTFKKKD